MMRLIYAILIISTMTGCDNIAYRASYEMTPTDRPTIPRAMSAPGVHVGRLANAADFATLPCPWIKIVGAKPYYDARSNVIVFGSPTYATTVAHEGNHARRHLAGLDMDEKYAMESEVAELMRQGWTDQAIMDLSENNKHSHAELVAIRKDLK